MTLVKSDEDFYSKLISLSDKIDRIKWDFYKHIADGADELSHGEFDAFYKDCAKRTGRRTRTIRAGVEFVRKYPRPSAKYEVLQYNIFVAAFEIAEQTGKKPEEILDWALEHQAKLPQVQREFLPHTPSNDTDGIIPTWLEATFRHLKAIVPADSPDWRKVETAGRVIRRVEAKYAKMPIRPNARKRDKA